MASWRAVGRCEIPCAALIAALLTTTAPASACSAMTVQELARRFPDAARHEAAAELLPALLGLWRRRRGDDLPAVPDGVAVFVARGQPLLLAFRTGDCLLGILLTPPDEVWRTLREQVGPVA